MQSQLRETFGSVDFPRPKNTEEGPQAGPVEDF